MDFTASGGATAACIVSGAEEQAPEERAKRGQASAGDSQPLFHNGPDRRLDVRVCLVFEPELSEHGHPYYGGDEDTARHAPRLC